MPASCSAFGCTNRFKTGESVQFFGFPLKNKNLLNSWVAKVRRKDFTPTKSSKICSDHFKESDFLVRPGTYVRKLKPDAIPTIFSAFPSYLKGNESKRRVLKNRMLNLSTIEQSMEVDHPIENASGSSSAPNNEVHNELFAIQQQDVPSKADKGIQTEENVVEQKLKQKIRTLNQKIRRRNKSITNFKEMVKVLRKKGLLQQEAENLLTQQFEGTALEIFKNQSKNFGRKGKGFRYSQEMKQFALTLHYHSPKAYEFCRSILCLPHKSAITNWTSSVNAEPGFFKEVFAALANFELADRDCNLVVDGMAIRKQLIWDAKLGKFIGYSDFGENVILESTDNEATEALVFMLVS